ncbi:hypothetical protein GCM10008014_48740 [Paenibacillus silvae]|uniref:Uncharacterized protein n=1 Tax=Paenibacillus silvae TaxID=1325358 RepID=A0ABQ1ZKJ4_9BACL|nr:hypothetical protein GCM10008014_48740 [Paenibacillus silvae]
MHDYRVACGYEKSPFATTTEHMVHELFCGCKRGFDVKTELVYARKKYS